MDTCFEMLPCEMKMKILNQLPLNDKKNARLVCKSWFQNLNNPNKLAFQAKLCDVTLTAVKNCTQAFIDSLLVHDLKASIDILQLPSAPNLILNHGISNSNLIKFLRDYCSCNDVETLELSTFLFGWIGVEKIRKIGSNLNWAHLKSLKLEAISRRSEDIIMPNIYTEFGKHVQSLAELLQLVSIPTLTSLSINSDFGNVSGHILTGIHHPFEALYKHLFHFLLRHAAAYDKLKEFEIHLKGNKISDFEFQFDYEPMDLSIVQFETFKIKVNNNEPGPFIFDLLNAQRNLKEFEINSNYWFIPMSLNDVITQQLLSRNHATLETVSIYGITHDLSWLSSSCSNLTSLNLVLISIDNLIYIPPTASLATSLQNVVQFSLVSFFGTPNGTDPRETQHILLWVIKNLPNLEQLELLFRHFYIFTIENVQLLINQLTKLNTISLFQPDLEAFDGFCSTTAGLSGQRILELNEYAGYQIKIDRSLYTGAENSRAQAQH